MTKRSFSYQIQDHKIIGDSVCRNLNFLKSLKTKSVKKQRRVLRLATSEELFTLIEIALNIIKARFPLSTWQRKRLIPYATFVRKLSRTRSYNGARNLLQKGAGVGLISLISPIIIEAIRYLALKT